MLDKDSNLYTPVMTPETTPSQSGAESTLTQPIGFASRLTSIGNPKQLGIFFENFPLLPHMIVGAEIYFV